MLQNQQEISTGVVRTVLGPVAAQDLGIVLINESLLSVYPGADLAPEINMDKSEIFETLKRKLNDFRRQGGQTIVDASGMFHGRDVWLYQTLSKATGVNIIATTGLGPEKLLGGYFVTPQTNPPTPWPAEKFAGLFTQEVVEGVVVPRVERSTAAGAVVSIANPEGITNEEKSLFRGSAQTARETGVVVSVQHGADAIADLELLLAEGVDPSRVVIGGVDRQTAVGSKAAFEIARRGAYASIDHIGWGSEEGYISDAERVRLVVELLEAGFSERVLLSTSAVGVAKGHPAKELAFDYLLSTFVPLLKKAGVTDEQIRVLLEENPQRVLTVDTTAALKIKEYSVAGWRQWFSPVDH
ncbi:phosphotriesterase-related protein [Planococcus glaciei]|uniref:phosphotriesterase family protein n=1 Tax=Planococcus glaciei TaxID=459472 RepID=UPI0008901C89|nr:phosphotriesterase [Planococcus glaciei]SDH47544.1 phosphotriesterase-related protein [Planococcus glaciei]